ncbi:hypothetical protein [Saccharicrinis aurantiacus]|uniref:hypothetical protein n=1 Tax=Saccharicrinis aurantiacus TaxID=1849719 RepID=UPI0024922898|nr:hypothetical protein [Saccharicrinis aurantiacus]
MADIIDVSFESHSQIKDSWNGSDLKENSDMQGGGLQEIIAYICRTRIDVLINDEDKRNPFNIENESFYEEGDEKDDFSGVIYCADFVNDLFKGTAIVAIEEEARFIIATVYKYYQRRMFALKEEAVFNMLEDEGWLEEEVNNPKEIASEIVINHFSKFKASQDIAELTLAYVKSYFNNKGKAIIGTTLINAEHYIKTGDFSGQKRKKILQALGASKNQVQEIKNNWAKIDDFISAKKLEKVSFEKDMLKTYKLNKEIKPLLNNDLNAAKKCVRKGEFIEKMTKSNFLKRTKSGVQLVDAVLSLKDAHNKDAMMDNLLSGVGACFGTGPGFAVSAFLTLGNDFWDNFENDLNESLVNSCGLEWRAICDIKNNTRLTPLMLVYKTEANERYKNKDIQATSIRITDINTAEEIFGFEPAFVNYYMPDNPIDVCRTRCY